MLVIHTIKRNVYLIVDICEIAIDGREHGKNFQTNPARVGVYFTKVTYEPDKYNDSMCIDFYVYL